MSSPNHHDPYLVATTGDLYQNPVDTQDHHKSKPSSAIRSQKQESTYFKSAQWSPDGTTLLTTSHPHTLSPYILPEELLSAPHPHKLKPYTSHAHPEPLYSTAFLPTYSLTSLPTCLYLSSPRSLPIRLLSPFSPDIISSYPLISPTTESYITPHSLLFPPNDDTHFLAGSDSCISLFDINRNGEGPVTRMPTTTSRRYHSAITDSGQEMRGIISALSCSTTGILAAGTFTSRISLYDSFGQGSLIASFALNQPNQPRSDGGGGITQLHFHPPTSYLIVASRLSNHISVFDIRHTGRQLARLTGRKANTQQRMGVDVIGDEVWAGGTDGAVRVWEGLGEREGEVESSWGWKAHGDVVSGVGVHSEGGVVATCSGSRHWKGECEDEEGAKSMGDNSLKIWAL